MFMRTLCAFALLASPAFAEFLVQDGDYYPRLRPVDTNFEPVRIVGGRVDRIDDFSLPIAIEGGIVGVIDTGLDVRIAGGRVEQVTAANEFHALTIEGGSIGEIVLRGNDHVVLRTGNFQLDTPINLTDILTLTPDGYTFMPISDYEADRFDLRAWFSDFSYGELSLTGFKKWLDFTPIYRDHFPGDTQGDGVVDLSDLNNVRNYFADPNVQENQQGDTNGDGLIDLKDLNNVRNNFGSDYRTTSNPVPEPPTLGLLLAGMTGYFLRRWSRCNANPV